MTNLPINLFKPFVSDDVDKPLLETLHSGYITEGPKVKEFEAAFAEYFGSDNIVSVNSGTSALTIALRLCNVGPDDEVITTAMTCTATNLPILSLGATPVFADIDPSTGLIDAESIAELVTEKTKAIMCCDWGGLPCDIAEIKRLTDCKLPVIEDAAHALGADLDGAADYICYSLQAIKHITTVDGGILVCKNGLDVKRAKNLRWFGIDREGSGLDSRIDQDIVEWGYKAHMNDVTATIGLAQLPHLDWVVKRQRDNALLYSQLLDPIFKTPPPFGSSSWLYTIQLPSKLLRNKFKDYMVSRKIMVNQVHKRNDDYTIFKPYARNLPNTTLFANRMVCLPVNWSLTDEDIAYVAKTANKFVKEYHQWF